MHAPAPPTDRQSAFTMHAPAPLTDRQSACTMHAPAPPPDRQSACTRLAAALVPVPFLVPFPGLDSDNPKSCLNLYHSLLQASGSSDHGSAHALPLLDVASVDPPRRPLGLQALRK